ncbi:MAG: hypothetical protein RBR53_03470 [Desulforegulaceae bacterium]|nr:hypothetical protein [Desulforegulaceae bacterium]
MKKYLKKLYKISVTFFCLLGILFFLSAVVFFFNAESKDIKSLLRKVSQKINFKAEITNYTNNEPKFNTHKLTGKIKADYPRTVFKSSKHIELLRNKYIEDEKYRKVVDSYTKKASKWLCSMDFEAGKEGVDSLLNSNVLYPRAAGGDGNGLDLALMYDFLFDYPDWTLDERTRVNLKLKDYIKKALEVLDGNSASMWHGRFQIACSNWVAAVVFDPFSKDDIKLVQRSQAHFLEALEAINITEGWPEGYSYWINNRAYPFVIACLTHLNAVDDPVTNLKIKKVLNSVGEWIVYGTRSDGFFHLFGDTGPRNDLKEETQRVVDILYLATYNPMFRDFSKYLSSLHGASACFWGYRWGIPVFRWFDTFDKDISGQYKDLSVLEKSNENLKKSRLFGENFFGQVFMRSGWTKQDTFISYIAGNSFTHHGHYKAGHFTIFKNSPLAISSGSYGGYTSEHRLNYYIRTVSSNSILILSPDECQKPDKFFNDCVSGGGQRIIIPTGSAITSIKNYYDNLEQGLKYQGGKILDFKNDNEDYVYILSDLTNAYSKEKAESAIRELVYLIKEDVLVVHDIVESVKKNYVKKWLLHSWSKPETINETIVKGSYTNGILETFDKKLEIKNGDGKLYIEAILPEKSLIRKIGGPDYRFYVETDGDEQRLDGKNMSSGAVEKKWFDSGLWRFELQSQDETKKTEFLVILKPSSKGEKSNLKYEKKVNKNNIELKINNKILIFDKNNKTKIKSMDKNENPSHS